MPFTTVQLNSLRDTTYQSNVPEGYEPAFDRSVQESDGMKTDYKDNEYCVTSLPQPETEELRRDGHAECMCTGWFKRKILSTPGFPSPIVHPPKVAYEVREAKLENQGLGVFATDVIQAGDLILAERPLVVNMIWSIGSVADKRLSQEEQLRGMLSDMEKNMELICSRMAPQTLKTFTSLHNSHKTDGSGPLTGIGRTNGFGLGIEDLQAAKLIGKGKAQYSATGATSSRFNHSCSPNAVYTFNVPSFSMEIHAVRPIANGEEITVTYAHEDDKAVDRQTSLKPYGFACACPACKDPATSDEERKRAISGLLPKTSQGVEHADATLAAFEATGLHCNQRYPELLRRVAQIHRKKGSKQRADVLETLADRVTTAQRGRTPKSNAPVETHIFTSPDDIMKFILQRADPNERTRMLQQLMPMGMPVAA